MDKYNEEIKQQIAETNERLEQTNETIIQCRVEVDAKIDQVEDDNRIRVDEIRQETHKKLDGMQSNISEKIEQINDEMDQVKNQVNNNKEKIENIQHTQLRNMAETRDSTFTRTNEHLENKIEGLREQKDYMVSQIIEANGKGIENKENKSSLLPENKNNRNKKNIKQLEKNTKEIGKIRQKELIKTGEELEMMKTGLVNVLNLPITDHTEIMKFKNCRRSLEEIL